MKIFYLPDLGEGLAEAEIREWYVKKNDIVTVDQPLVSMETAKAVVDVPSPYSGKIVELHGDVNDIIKTGAPFITFELEEEHAIAKEGDKGSVVGALEESSKQWKEEEVVIADRTTTTQSHSTSIKAMPAARVLANELGVDLSQVISSGPQGLITPADVKRHLEQSKTPTSAQSTLHHASSLSGKKEVLHGVKRAMAMAMMQSHQEIVPVTVIEDVDISHFTAKSDITVNLLNAIVAAVKIEPTLNAWFDGKALERHIFEEVNIGLAVDTPDGLFVPVIKSVEKQSNTALRDRINYYKQGVFNRSLPPQDMQGATITLSNFGMITGRYATPIIVPPMVAILGCGRIHDAPVIRDGSVVVGRILPLSFTFDHRAATGGEATRFLKAIIQYLQTQCE